MSYDILRNAGNTVSFDVIPNLVTPKSYANVTTQGVVSFMIANSINSDIVAKWQQVRPNIPSMSDDFEAAEYVIVQHTSGAVEVLGLDWIDEKTITSSSVVTKIVRISNVPSSSNNKIIMALARAGFEDVTITDQ